MRILLATPAFQLNPYAKQLALALRSQPSVTDVVIDLDAFWQATDFDIVHVQWPEALFGWNYTPTEMDIERLRERLQAWKQSATLVATVHNRFPHYRRDPIYRQLYVMVYGMMDGFVHLGSASVAEFQSTFPEFRDTPLVTTQIGRVDTYFGSSVSQAEARQRLGIPADKFVYLSLGYLRDYEETEFLLRGFRKLALPDKYLVIAGNVITFSDYRLLRIYRRLRVILNPKVSLFRRLLDDSEIQSFANSADVLVIPRLQAMNSSGISLGFSYGKVVVGPDIGNIGETLREAGNPTFRPNDTDSLAQALLQARDLSRAGLGQENRHFAERNMDWNKIAAQHVAFFSDLTKTGLRTKD